MTRINHRLDGQPEMTPSALRAEIRQAIIDDRIVRKDLERWVPNMSREALSRFIERGEVRNGDDKVLVQIEFAWRLYKQGRLLPAPRKREPTEAQREAARRNGRATRRYFVTIGGIGPYYHISDPNDPLWNLDKERRLAAKKLADMGREETDALGISQTNCHLVRHGRIPKFKIPTIMKLLEPKRSQAHGSQQTDPIPADHDGQAEHV